MNSNEFDRYAWFCTDSSIRGNLDWERFCEIEIDLPPLPVQQKYVNVYNAMVKNQKAYESGLDDLKLTCDAYIDELRRKLPHKAIGEYVELSNAKNEDLQYGIDALKGVSINKEFIATKADMAGVSLKPYLLVEPDAFAYVTITSRNGEKISLAHNNSDDTYIVSSSYIVFRVKRKDKLIPSYLNIFFKRSEFDRYARFNSWGSAREAFAWEDMCEVKIPIPDIKVQQSIVNIYNAYITRRDINERLKAQIKDICPILIKGSLEEAKNA
jgi:type I restriction enzyme S subunit